MPKRLCTHSHTCLNQVSDFPLSSSKLTHNLAEALHQPALGCTAAQPCSSVAQHVTAHNTMLAVLMQLDECFSCIKCSWDPCQTLSAAEGNQALKTSTCQTCQARHQASLASCATTLQWRGFHALLGHLDVSCCEKGHLLLTATGTSDDVVPGSGVIHVARAENGSVWGSAPSINAPLLVYADAII